MKLGHLTPNSFKLSGIVGDGLRQPRCTIQPQLEAHNVKRIVTNTS